MLETVTSGESNNQLDVIVMTLLIFLAIALLIFQQDQNEITIKSKISHFCVK